MHSDWILRLEHELRVDALVIARANSGTWNGSGFLIALHPVGKPLVFYCTGVQRTSSCASKVGVERASTIPSPDLLLNR